MSPATPAAVFACPMLAFTDPIAQRAPRIPGPNACERSDLDRVPEMRPGAVGVDVRNVASLHTGDGHCLANHRCLPLHARRCEADLRRPVVVHRRATDDGMDVIAIHDGCREPLQDDDANPPVSTVPLALASNGRHFPSGDAIPPSWYR